MDDLAILIRGIGKIAAALRERADTVKWANASHLHAIADSIDHELQAVEPRRRQWRDAPTGPVVTCAGIDTIPAPDFDKLEPIRAAFRQCGLYNHAADDLLCQNLLDAATRRTVEVPVRDMEVPSA